MSDMLKRLKFVQGAVAKRGLLPALNHFRIEGGHVRSFNGTLALSSPIPVDIDCIPKAEPFIKAIQKCKDDDTITLNLTPNGRLAVKSGSFRAFIPTVDMETSHLMPEGEEFSIDGEVLLRGFKTILPFVGKDASRPWSNGILLQGQSMFATNNVSIIEFWIGENFPVTCNVPCDAIREVVRIGEAPNRVQLHERSISFHYTDGRWIRSVLFATTWPKITRILDVKSKQHPVDASLYEALDAVKPFTDNIGRVYLKDGVLRTSVVDMDGASYEIPKIPYEGVFQLPILMLLKGVANSIDFTLYPKPCIFYGDNIRGAIIGMMP